MDMTTFQGQPHATYLPKSEATARYPREKTALLVIDPVNDFLSEGGAGWEMTKTTVKMNNVVENIKRLMDGVRKRGIPVLIGPMAYTEEDYATEQLHRRSGINRVMFEKKMFLAGTWGADFHPELQPAEGDIVLLPHKSCDVFESDLPEQLGRLGTTHIVIAGMAANLCCESTGRRAVEKGFDVTYVSDAIGAESVMAYEASIRVNYPLLGNAVITVDEFFAAVDASDRNDTQVRVGDKVIGSDHGEIGTVKEVAAATGQTPGHMLVPRGLIFHTDTYIPLDAVVQRGDGEVFINVPKMVVSAMPWGEPPKAGDRQAKLGPPASTVDKLYRSQSPSIQETTQRRGM